MSNLFNEMMEEISEKDKKISDLEAKLAENEEIIRLLRMSNDALREDNLDLSYNQVDNVYETATEMSKGWEGQYQEEIAQLKQQLAEKEKEIKKWKNKKIKYLVDNLLGGKNLAIQTVEEIREDFRQNSFCNDYHEYIVNMEIFEYFNNKIKSLKGEK